jgi:DNA-binding NtrC family response regulator
MLTAKRGVRVLLVDDDDSLRRALMRTLHRARFEVEAFKSVEALLARGVPNQDACLVLDIDLPGIGGIEFKRALVESGRDLPTVFITALEPPEVSEPLAVLPERSPRRDRDGVRATKVMMPDWSIVS